MPEDKQKEHRGAPGLFHLRAQIRAENSRETPNAHCKLNLNKL